MFEDKGTLKEALITGDGREVTVVRVVEFPTAWQAKQYAEKMGAIITVEFEAQSLPFDHIMGVDLNES